MNQFGIFGDDLRNSIKVLRKVIDKQDDQNMANIDFIIGSWYLMRQRLPMGLMITLSQWVNHSPKILTVTSIL